MTQLQSRRTANTQGGRMNHLNSILVEGNLVRDPNFRSTPSGNQVCDFTVATNRNYKIADQKYENEVSYFDIEAWARLGSACAQNLKKGRGVRVSLPTTLTPVSYTHLTLPTNYSV